MKRKLILIIFIAFIVFFISFSCTTIYYNIYCNNNNYPVQVITKDYGFRYYIKKVIREDDNFIEIIDKYNEYYKFNKVEYIIKYQYNTGDSSNR